MSDPAPPIEVPTSAGSLEIPRDRVYIATISPGKVGAHFARSLVDLVDFDREHALGLWRGNLWQESGANISKGRNELVARFLGLDDADWLLMLDSDMVFPRDTILRLLAAATITGARMVGGLCVLVGPHGPVPTLYQHRTDDAITGVQWDFPDDAQLQVAATGTACLMVHRSVLEDYRVRQHADQQWLWDLHAAGDSTLDQLVARDLVREPSVEYGWFQERVRLKRRETVDGVSVDEHWMGEDIDFCLRMGSLGHSIFVDCTLEIGHAKHGRIWYPADIRSGTGAPPAPIVAVIPTVGATDATGDRVYVVDLVHQLLEQGDVDEIVVIDNGLSSTPPVLQSFTTLADGRPTPVTVLDMPDAGIHEMWNAAVDYALEAHGPRARCAFLNDDLRLGPAFLRTLSQALTDDRTLTAVCGNYDGRRADVAVVETTDICARRYDGTGGFAGFAFMARGEWFGTGYRFPEEFRWWCGDNDLIASIAWADAHRGYDDRPSKAGIVIAARVEHLDGGGASAGDPGWSAFREQTILDGEAFKAKWSKIYETEANAERIRAGDYRPLYEHLLGQPSDIQEHLATLHDLAVKLDAKNVIELGVRSGVSSIAWLAALQQTGGHLWCVDIEAAPSTITAHPRCTFVRGDDLAPAVMAQLPAQADIVFIDTDHRYELTRAEIAAYSGRVRPGGAMVFHDTGVETFDHHEPGTQPPFPVGKAVEEWIAGAGLEYGVDRFLNCNGLTIVRWPERSVA